MSRTGPRTPLLPALLLLCILSPVRVYSQAPQAVQTAQSQPADPAAPVEFPSPQTARAKVNEILSRHEFRSVQEPTALQQKIARAWFWFSQALNKATGLLPQSTLYGVVLQWGVLIAAAGALMFWVFRVSQQQRLDLGVGRAATNEVWQKESDNWAERARNEAARGDWREAVHCLYWSAIVLLEGQKMWRQNRARTPREYVVLLEPGSEKRTALQGLTRVFERIWYGLRPAAESDYRQATAMLDQLRAR